MLVFGRFLCVLCSWCALPCNVALTRLQRKLGLLSVEVLPYQSPAIQIPAIARPINIEITVVKTGLFWYVMFILLEINLKIHAILQHVNISSQTI